MDFSFEEKAEKVDLKDYVIAPQEKTEFVQTNFPFENQKSQVYPKTRANLFFDASHNTLRIESVKLQEIISFNLHKRLSAELGLLVYTRKNVNLTQIMPKLVFNFLPVGIFSISIGKNAAFAGFNRSFKLFDIKLFAGVSNNDFCFVGEVKKKINSQTEVSAKVSNPISVVFKAKKQFKNNSLSIFSENSVVKTVNGASVTQKLTNGVSLVLGSEIATTKVHELNKVSLGVKLDLSPLSKISYFFENFEKNYYFRMIFQRGGLKLNIPIKISKISILLGCVVVVVSSYITKSIFNYFTSSELNTEKEDPKEVAKEYVNMIQNKAEMIVLEEKQRNGLIILKAVYGDRDSIIKVFGNSEFWHENLLDVTVSLNFLIENSRISIPSGSKSFLPGFYKVCESPVLYLHYSYLGVEKKIVIRDDESFSI